MDDIQTITESANILALEDGLPEEDLFKIADKVVKEYELDMASNEEYFRKSKEAMKLAKQVAEEKTIPWRGASNVKYPLITVAAIQFAARAYPVIVGQQKVVKGRVIGSDAGIPQIDEMGQPVMTEQGPVFAVQPGAKRARADRVADHMSWQLLEEMEEWEDDTDSLLHTVPIAGCMFRKVFFDPDLGRNRSKILYAKQVIVHKDTKSLKNVPRISEPIKLYPYEIEERVRAGLWVDIDLEDYEDERLEEFVEQHTRIDMDGDGYPEPYIVTVHLKTRQITRIAPNFTVENIKMSGDRIRKITPQEYYIKYPFIPDPDGGFYDIGFGQLMLPINESVNTLLNQLIDAGTLANRGGGFLGKGIRIRAGEQKFKIGEWKRVDVGTGSIRDNVFPLPVKDPSNVLFSLLGLLIDAAKDISSVQDIMTGQVQQPTQPTTALALIEQGMRVFTGIYKRIYRSLKKELGLLYHLNRKFLTDEEYFTVMDNPQAVARADYADDIAVVPVADPNMVSDAAKQKKAEILMSQMGNPYLNGMEITKRFLEALGVENPETLIVTPQPDPEVMKDVARLENDRMRAEATVFETRAKALEIVTRAANNLAQAKNRKEDREIETILATLGFLANYIGVLDVNPGQGLVGSPGDAGIPQAAQGAGAPNQIQSLPPAGA